MAEELDTKVWSELPAEILERVLRWLPFSTLCKFRAVCKYWNTLPTVRAEQPYILDIPCNTKKDYVTCLRYCCLYSPTANTWDFIDLSFLPQRMTQLSSCPCYWTPQIERFCSDGGLLCVWGKLLERDLRYYFSDIIPHYTILVCNPLTKRCKLLPPFDFTYQGSIDLVMKRESSGEYKIFAVALAYTGAPGLYLRHYMYDSASDSWMLLLDLKRDCSDVSLLRFGSIIFDGVYYCVSGGGRQPYDLYAYNIKQNSWIAAGVKIKLNPKTTRVLFVVSNGRLLLIASILEEKLYFSINQVDLRRTETMYSPAVYVSLPANFTWKRGVALAYRDSIIFASESKCRFMAVDLLSLSADLKELKSITPMSVIPTSERYTQTNMANASFDVQATV
ncbi:hypothetical protein M758_2G220500 [Ceratodon purpureus]|nr:hypothetical protein M758_2G220500 [Ceratodon purpureus]